MADIIKWIQLFLPLVVKAVRGYCLKYVDDATKAPKRTATARAALNNEIKAKRLQAGNPPTNIWVYLFFDLRTGQWAGYDHVALGKYKGNGKWEIRDSETESGFRSRYTTVQSLLAWFGAYSPKYVGWSTHCDGRQIAKKTVTKVADKKTYHTVRSGDTLSGIATKHKTTYQKLMKFPENKKLIKNVNNIKVGWKVRVK